MHCILYPYVRRAYPIDGCYGTFVAALVIRGDHLPLHLLSGAAGAATACLMSNCGWAVCMGAGAGGTVVACAVAELF